MFEYDPDKSRRNQAKHGIDFDEAQSLWEDDRRVEIEAYSTVEQRLMIIAQMQGKYWSALFTYRSENIRIISVRRSRPNEVKLYES